MSSLDLGAPSPEPTPAAPVAGFSLEAPAPVELVAPSAAVATVPVSSQALTVVDQKANQFVDGILALKVNSPEFTQRVDDIVKMGDTEVRKSSDVSNRMLSRPAAQNESGSAQAKVGKTLADLRTTVTDLDPNRADLTGIKKVLKWIPGGNKIDNYFNRYRSAQDHIDAIVRALASGQDELRRDNADIEVERRAMWDAMGKLAEYNTLTEALDRAVVAKLEEAKVAGNSELATALESDVLFAVRQRRQDIQTQMAVSVQGYLALDLVRKNNLELIRGVDRAQTTTLSALRTAVIVSQALAQQKLVLDQITSLNASTSNMIEATSQMLKTQGAEINRQAASSTIEVEKLQRAFQNVFDTMDAIDTFRAQANSNMAQTITALESQVQKAQPYLERSRRGQVSGDQIQGMIGK